MCVCVLVVCVGVLVCVCARLSVCAHLSVCARLSVCFVQKCAAGSQPDHLMDNQ